MWHWQYKSYNDDKLAEGKLHIIERGLFNEDIDSASRHDLVGTEWNI